MNTNIHQQLFFWEVIIMVELVSIKQNEMKKAYKMHRRGFMTTFFKYYDRINPIFESYKKFSYFYNHPTLHMYWIIFDGKKVGEIWIGVNDDKVKLARLFVLKKYQNQGIATQAILLAEKIFSDRPRWWLNTIKEEKNNCHLYEKLGYNHIGSEKRINKRMTIIEYEKRII